VRLLEDDLRVRLTEHPDLDAPVRAEYERARGGGRTGQSYNVWRDEYLTQVAVHWVLAAVFVRFLEDNRLLPEPWLSGTGTRFDQARDRHAQFFVREPAASDREYLLAGFREVESLPAMAPLFDERHNPLFLLGPSADGARTIIDLFRKVEPTTGALVHDFADETWNTRFLGDLYQDLSESARKRFALLQTPEFVEEFLLDRTLEPAIAEVGIQKVTLIDPACGSGHFLLGAFRRIFDRWQTTEPLANPRDLARRALDQISGVDVNPFAVAIARFRLLIAALKVSEIQRMMDAPAFPLNLAAGDSLLHGERLLATRGIQMPLVGEDRLAHVYNTEDAEALRRILGRKYTVVVGNPPYITPKDPAENEAYRDRFGSCSGKYSLAVPFTERFFDLAHPESGQPAGWVGMITSNSFMKREFGRKLIEKYIPRWDLTHVIDTSGAHIPGHGTPTVILIGRSRPPVNDKVRAVMGIRGEPSTPDDPSKGLVWTAITCQIDFPGSSSEFVSIADIPLSRLHHHPWSIGGGGASELFEIIATNRPNTLRQVAHAIGVMAVPGEDEVFISERFLWWIRSGAKPESIRPLISGENIRDWSLSLSTYAIYPYENAGRFQLAQEVERHFWNYRTILKRGIYFGKTKEARQMNWRELAILVKDKLQNPLSISFAFVATHNHFVFDRGGKVFKQTAPVIKLPTGRTEDDHLAILGLLNSSTGCFWMKQVFFNRGTGGIGGGIASEDWERFFEHDGTKLQQFPMSAETPTELARELDQLSEQLDLISPARLLRSQQIAQPSLAEAKNRSEIVQRRMIAIQEELDWQVYRLYGLLEDPLEQDHADVPEVAFGERPFEIVLARKIAAGEIETKWFERHGSTPITEIPDRWPEPYRCLVERRMQAISENPWIALIEQPEFKRRWNREPWEEQEKRALRNWLLDRLEDRRYWPEPPTPTSTARLADRLRQDDEFRQVAALYQDRDDFDWTELVTELALEDAVPFLAAQCYTDTGLRKRDDWEETWRLQRLEDQGKVDGKDIPMPPRYASADFRKQSYWRLRGKLDVPKERFIHYPGLERGADPSPVIGWAGWNHLEQAQALGTAFHELREKEGWGRDQLSPLLAGLLELLPWVQQWYNEPDPAHGGLRLGDFFAGFLDEEARALGLTRDELASWRPAAKTGRGRKKKDSNAS
jgi:hypothetical protein